MTAPTARVTASSSGVVSRGAAGGGAASRGAGAATFGLTTELTGAGSEGAEAGWGAEATAAGAGCSTTGAGAGAGTLATGGVPVGGLFAHPVTHPDGWLAAVGRKGGD